MADNLRLRLEILATGAGRTVGEIRSVQQAAAAAATEARAASTTIEQGTRCAEAQRKQTGKQL